jgi:hypothetical protein
MPGRNGEEIKVKLTNVNMVAMSWVRFTDMRVKKKYFLFSFAAYR